MQFSCVKVGDKYNDEYVLNLQRGIARNLPSREGHTFVCYTDKPIEGVICEPPPCDLPGWWAKIGLFKLREPMIFFDLDVVITGDLQRLIDWEGFGIIQDWWQPCFNSSVMKLTGNEGFVWDRFDNTVMNRMHGDQDWITAVTAMRRTATFPSTWFPSYKADKCEARKPDDAVAVIFHGNPKPHVLGGWVAEEWRKTPSNKEA